MATNGEPNAPRLTISLSTTKIQSYTFKPTTSDPTQQYTSTTRTPSSTRKPSSSKPFRTREQQTSNKSQTHRKKPKPDPQQKKTNNKSQTPRNKSNKTKKAQITRSKSKGTLRNKGNKPQTQRNKLNKPSPQRSKSKATLRTAKRSANTPKSKPRTPSHAKKTQHQRTTSTIRRSKYFPTPVSTPRIRTKTPRKPQQNKKIRSKTPVDNKRKTPTRLPSPRSTHLSQKTKKTAQIKRSKSPQPRKHTKTNNKPLKAAHSKTAKSPPTKYTKSTNNKQSKHTASKTAKSSTNNKQLKSKANASKTAELSKPTKSTKPMNNKQLKLTVSNIKERTKKNEAKLPTSASLKRKAQSSPKIPTSRSLKAKTKGDLSTSSALRKTDRNKSRPKVPNRAAPKRPPSSQTSSHSKTKSLSLQRNKKQKKHNKIARYKLPSPISPHPTIGEFYSKRVRKKKLIKRELPPRPEKVGIYFILMGKIYKYNVRICLFYRLSQILAKLSPLLALNDEILSVIHHQIGKDSRGLSNLNGNGSSYDLIINDPIFIYKNDTYNGSETFDSIGFKDDFELRIGEQYITILSCTGNARSSKVKHQRGHSRSRTHNDIYPSLSPSISKKSPSIDLPLHSPSLSNSSSLLGFQSLSNIANVLSLQRNNSTNSDHSLFSNTFDNKNDPIFKQLKHCVQKLGFTLSDDVNKQQLIAFVNESIHKMDNDNNDDNNGDDNDNDNDNTIIIYGNDNEMSVELKDDTMTKQKKKKRKRGRSRSWAGLKIEVDDGLVPVPSNLDEIEDNYKTNSNNAHHRYNHSVPDMSSQIDALRLDLSSVRTHRATLDVIDDRIVHNRSKSKTESRFSRLFKRPFGTKKKVKQASLTPVILNKSASAEIIDVEAALDEYKSFEEETKTKSKTKAKTYTIRDKKGKIKRITSMNNNQIKATLIVDGYLNSSNDNIKWKKLYFTMNRDRLLSEYLNKNCDLTQPIDTLSLSHGQSSFNINNLGMNSNEKQIITVTVKTSNKCVIKFFKGTPLSLEKWKRAFLF